MAEWNEKDSHHIQVSFRITLCISNGVLILLLCHQTSPCRPHMPLCVDLAIVVTVIYAESLQFS